MTIDIDAILAAEAEVRGEPHEITFKGETFIIPRSEDWPADAVDELTSGRFMAAMVGILNAADVDEEGKPSQAQRFYDLEPTMAAVEAILDATTNAEGFQNRGERRASKRSSKSTGTRSRPTSSVTTK